MACIQEADKLETAGRPTKKKLASRDANYGKSAAEVAETVGVSQATVERARTVFPPLLQIYRNGKTRTRAKHLLQICRE